MIYVNFVNDPDAHPPMHSMAPLIGGLTALIVGLFVSVPAGGILAVGSAMHVARQMKNDAHDALDAREYDRARQLMIEADILERNGFSSSDDDEAPPQLIQDRRQDVQTPATSSLDVKVLSVRVQAMSIDDVDDTASQATTLTLPSSDDLPPTDTPPMQDDFTAGCPPKPYSGRAPTAEERRTWEAAATRYYQSLLSKYQQAIEQLRVVAHEFLQQDGLDVSKFVERHSRMCISN
jgi:hypothetical protein